MCIQTCISTPKLLDSIQIQHLLTKNGFPKGLPRNSELRIEKMRLYIEVMRPWFSVWMYPFQFSYWYLNSWLLVSRGRISQELVKTCVPNPQQGIVSLRKNPRGLSCILYLMREMFSKVQEMSLSENKYFSVIALVSLFRATGNKALLSITQFLVWHGKAVQWFLHLVFLLSPFQF